MNTTVHGALCQPLLLFGLLRRLDWFQAEHKKIYSVLQWRCHWGLHFRHDLGMTFAYSGVSVSPVAARRIYESIYNDKRNKQQRPFFSLKTVLKSIYNDKRNKQQRPFFSLKTVLKQKKKHPPPVNLMLKSTILPPTANVLLNSTFFLTHGLHFYPITAKRA